MSDDHTATPNPEALAALNEALQKIAAGDTDPLFDAEHEQAKSKVRERALRLLDHRMRSEKELRTRLLDLEFPTQLVEEVVEDLRAAGLINDAFFASEWVRQRHAAKGSSRMVLRRELRDKGISEDLQQQALDSISQDDEEAAARAAAVKKARSISTPPTDYAEYTKYLRRVVGVLARRGYGAEMSQRIARAELNARIRELGGTVYGQD